MPLVRSPANFPNCRKPARGFTLLELLITIGIIGILIAAVLVIVPKVKLSVYKTQTSAQLAALSNAIQQYYSDYKSYPGPLANSQLDTADDGSAPPVITLVCSDTGMSTSQTSGTLNATHITGAENLVLALCGGLRANATTGALEYHPEDLFNDDGMTLNAKGASSLDVNNPRRQMAYLQIKSGDLSVPNDTINGGVFTDEAGRYGTDSLIPEFMDKYASPLPILYYRTNAGGTAIVGFRNQPIKGGSGGLIDNVTPGDAEIAQYDLLANYGYTSSTIGTTGNTVLKPMANPNSIHGLIGLGTATNLGDKIDVSGVPSNAGANGIAYFKDPVLNPVYDPTATIPPSPPSNTHQGIARQKDGFVLISAGPDRLYGTSDDTINPGPLVP